jgi:transcriptional regulator with GAF, ATPase, and Fis domain
LVKFFVDKFSRKFGKRIENIPQSILKELEDYAWPGNVRELINVVERAAIVSNGFDLQLAERLSAPPMDFSRSQVLKESEPRQPKNLIEVERDYIFQTLQSTGWRVEGRGGAAQLLGLNPSTLRTRMRKFDIRRKSAS